MATEHLGAAPSANNDLVRQTDITELAQDATGAMATNSPRITLTYNDATPSLTADLIGNSVVDAYLSDMAQSTIKGRAAGAGTGDPTDLTAAQVKTILAITGADVSFSPTGNIAATTVQTAIAEVDSETDARLDALEASAGTTQHVFTANGSLASATVSGAKKLRIRCVGGGGAGGGAEATGAGQSSGGAGGQGGHYAETVVTVSSLTFPLQVNRGAGGTAASGAAGGNGGTSSVVNNNGAGSTLCSAGGGDGGGIVTTAAAAGAFGAPGDGAAGSMVGDIQVKGNPGTRAFKNAAAGPVFGGAGGASVLGGGTKDSIAGNYQGTAGGQYGGGGGGSCRLASAAALSGGGGANGVVIIDAIY